MKKFNKGLDSSDANTEKTRLKISNKKNTESKKPRKTLKTTEPKNIKEKIYRKQYEMYANEGK